MFDRLDHHGGGSQQQSRKYTANSNLFGNEEGTPSEDGTSTSGFRKDIFSNMNIGINYGKDQQSDF